MIRGAFGAFDATSRSDTQRNERQEIKGFMEQIKQMSDPEKKFKEKTNVGKGGFGELTKHFEFMFVKMAQLETAVEIQATEMAVLASRLNEKDKQLEIMAARDAKRLRNSKFRALLQEEEEEIVPATQAVVQINKEEVAEQVMDRVIRKQRAQREFGPGKWNALAQIGGERSSAPAPVKGAAWAADEPIDVAKARGEMPQFSLSSIEEVIQSKKKKQFESGCPDWILPTATADKDGLQLKWGKQRCTLNIMGEDLDVVNFDFGITKVGWPEFIQMAVTDAALAKSNSVKLQKDLDTTNEKVLKAALAAKARRLKQAQELKKAKRALALKLKQVNEDRLRAEEQERRRRDELEADAVKRASIEATKRAQEQAEIAKTREEEARKRAESIRDHEQQEAKTKEEIEEAKREAKQEVEAIKEKADEKEKIKEMEKDAEEKAKENAKVLEEQRRAQALEADKAAAEAVAHAAKAKLAAEREAKAAKQNEALAAIKKGNPSDKALKEQAKAQADAIALKAKAQAAREAAAAEAALAAQAAKANSKAAKAAAKAAREAADRKCREDAARKLERSKQKAEKARKQAIEQEKASFDSAKTARALASEMRKAKDKAKAIAEDTAESMANFKAADAEAKAEAAQARKLKAAADKALEKVSSIY